MAAGRRIATYLCLTVLFSGICDAAIIHAGALGAARGMFVVALMWSPGLAALLTCRLTGKPVAELGWGWGETRWQLLALAIPIGYALAGHAAVWLIGWGGFFNHEPVTKLAESAGLGGLPPAAALVFYLVATGTAGLPINVAHALGEEIGWRGFLVPELARVTGFAGVALASGIVWTLYHVPILLYADYNSGTPAWYALSCFAVMVVSSSVVLAWLRLRSGSLWTAALLHAAHNLYIQGIFEPLTVDTGRTKWAIGEFGFGVPIATAIVAVYFWRRRGELPAPQRVAGY